MLSLIIIALVFCYLFSKFIEPLLGVLAGGSIFILGLVWISCSYEHFDTILDFFTKIH